MRSGCENFQRPGWRSSSAARPIQIVGTPNATVTPSCSINASKLDGLACGPGKTSFVPNVTEEYGTPHPFTWNIDATSSATSFCAMPKPSAVEDTRECSTKERWE